MYAVFQSGGKQHRVSEGQVVRLEKIDSLISNIVVFNQVLMIANDEYINIGSPFIIGGTIHAEIIAHGRSKKIKIIKFRARKHYRKHQGHRQYFTDVKIITIKDSVRVSGDYLTHGA
ncbi:50S ribosomal protein L21 [Candidatus Erwinia haradaeae]|uniref:Large ribosomal subunit protein bL21 n=1 Tax=Candidatus Erwinia haradaeae TaxID=1922217 RepID=A0A451DKR2_9GAMM|nr:50S ribosomal protein L21 [Candidatus Erwinia haradaeae]VFP87314.1 50S ribosomal protein L21 [Candidatus Erwinia haradaeae]